MRVVTRQWLHRELWRRPATDIARELGMTSTAVAKIARKLAVPVPPPGHWARVRAGQSVEAVALPPPLAGEPTRHRIVRVVVPPPPPAPTAQATATDLGLVTSRDAALATRAEPMHEAAARSLAALERVATLRTLVDKLTPLVGSLPPNAPQRRWLDDARAEIARAEAEALAALGG
jgi:hypothetical protein